MDATQIALVKDTFALVEPIQEQAAVLFYRRLFDLDPNIARLFATTDMDRQRKVLMQTLAVVVRGLDRLDQVVPGVQALGRRHRTYGVEASDYPIVASALLWTLDKGLGGAFTPAARQAWSAAIGLLAATMIEAADAIEERDRVGAAEAAPEVEDGFGLAKRRDARTASAAA